MSRPYPRVLKAQSRSCSHAVNLSVKTKGEQRQTSLGDIRNQAFRLIPEAEFAERLRGRSRPAVARQEP
jgi:hypothetical protein